MNFERKQLFRKPTQTTEFWIEIAFFVWNACHLSMVGVLYQCPSGHLSDIEVKSKKAGTRTITVSMSDVRSSIVNALTKYTAKTRPLIMWGIRPELLIKELPAEASSEYSLQPDGMGDLKSIFQKIQS